MQPMQNYTIIDKIRDAKQAMIQHRVVYSPTRLYLGQQEMKQLKALAVDMAVFSLPMLSATSTPTEVYGLDVFEVAVDSHFFIA